MIVFNEGSSEFTFPPKNQFWFIKMTVIYKHRYTTGSDINKGDRKYFKLIAIQYLKMYLNRSF